MGDVELTVMSGDSQEDNLLEREKILLSLPDCMVSGCQDDQRDKPRGGGSHGRDCQGGAVLVKLSPLTSYNQHTF